MTSQPPERPPPEAGDDEDAIRAATSAAIEGLGDGPADRSLITVLQAVQRSLGYLPRAALLQTAETLGVAPARVYGVATFYNQFRFTPPGRTVVKVCMGTACAIKLGGVILDAWERRLGIGVGETTPDREHSLERVACVGCCSLAPVALVDETIHGNMTPTKVDGLLLQRQIAAQEATRREPMDSAPEGDVTAPTGEGP